MATPKEKLKIFQKTRKSSHTINKNLLSQLKTQGTQALQKVTTCNTNFQNNSERLFLKAFTSNELYDDAQQNLLKEKRVANENLRLERQVIEEEKANRDRQLE